jgi:cation transport ATPase
VRWDERRIKLSDILAAIQAIGYRAYPYDAARSEQISQRERRSALWRLFVAGFGMMQVMMYAFPAYIAADGEMTADIEVMMRWASLILTAPVVLYSAAPSSATPSATCACAGWGWTCPSLSASGPPSSPAAGPPSPGRARCISTR